MGKDKEVENTTVSTDAETEDTGTETQEPVLPANKEELDALLAGATERGKLEAEDVYKGIQRTVSRKDEEIERLKRSVPQPETNDDFTLYEAMIADRKGKGEFESNDPVTLQMEANLKARKDKVSRDSQARYQEKVIGDNREKFNKQIEDAGLDPNDEKLDDFHDLFADAEEDGRFGKAERKLNRILSKVEPKKGKPEAKESEEERVNKLVDEKLRAKMEEKGMLNTDNNLPSGTGASALQWMEKYKKGECDAEEAKKHGCTFL